MKILNMKIKDYILSHKHDLEKWNEDSFGGVHIKILEYLQNIENGFFVEVGAHDGISQSNTLILEQCGWKGLLIEASDVLFKKCRENRKCIIENYALVSSLYDKKFIKSTNSIHEVHNNEGIILMGDDEDGICPTITFAELARNHNIKKVDIFFLDVESYEIEVLNGIDFNEVDITYFVIEVNYTIEEMDKLMLKNGYENIRNISNSSKL